MAEALKKEEPLDTGDTQVDAAPDESRTDDLAEFVRGYSATRTLVTDRRNTLDKQYVIDTGQPLPQFDSAIAKAYAVTDEKSPSRELYGVVLPDGYAVRERALKALRTIRHPNMVELVAAGRVDLANPAGIAFVMVFTRPQGKPLSAILRENPKGFAERFLTQDIMGPINQVLVAFAEAGICHGRIHPDRVYFGDKVTLGECLSEPCGYSQPFLYEPPERVMAPPIGKGEGDSTVDAYALGVLALRLIRPDLPFDQWDKQSYINEMFEQGAYNTLTRSFEFSGQITDFFRGTLNDSRSERWTSNHIKLWADGRRYNIIQPSAPRDATRPFVFKDKEFFSGRALANALHNDWDAAILAVRDPLFVRWVEISSHSSEMGDLAARITRGGGNESTSVAKQSSEMVARCIVMLDPEGPLRLRGFCSHVDALGPSIAFYLLQKNQEMIAAFHELIEDDLHSFWSDQQDEDPTTDASNALFKLHKIRLAARYQSLGFGMERILYDLNPTLPCQSSLVLRSQVQTLEELLIALDSVARDRHRESAPVDRHVAAFVTSRTDLNKEIKFTEFAHNPQMAMSPKLVMLKILSIAYEKASKHKFPGLAHWALLEIWPMLDNIHNRSLRKEIQVSLKKAAKSGNLTEMLRVATDAGAVQSDKNGFEYAQQRYQYNAARIMELKNRDMLRSEAKKIGYKFSLAVAYIVCIVTFYMIFNHTFLY